VFDLVWTDGPLGRVTYGDVYHQNEVEQSKYNFEYADIDELFRQFDASRRSASAARSEAAAAGYEPQCSRPRTPSTCSTHAGDLGHGAPALHPCACARSRRGVARLLREPRGARLPMLKGAEVVS